MSELLRDVQRQKGLWTLLIIVVVLGLSLAAGYRASLSLLLLILAGLGALLLVRQPALALLAMIAAALLGSLEIGTGSAVNLNFVTILIPVLFALWLATNALRGEFRLARSSTYRPLSLLLILGVASLLIGNATWDPFVLRPGNFLLVQIAQLAIFFFSAAAYLLAGNLIEDETWLSYMTWTFLYIGGTLAVLYVLPPTRPMVARLTTAAITRAPFWMLLGALAGGQLLFNRSLVVWKQVLLAITLGAAGYYALVWQREVVSAWIGLVAVVGTLFWLRFPRVRWLVLIGLISLLIAGILFPALYQFAGGDAEWQLSGISRIDLGRRVIEVTSRNPITGLGPASYRVYASAEPLTWRGGSAIWIGAVVSSHNNYIDVFSFFGIVGLALFFWLLAAIGLLGLRLRKRFHSGFASGYVNGVLAALAGSMVLMIFADWVLPFVYNIGFPGFQASVLIWVFMGGLVALEAMPKKGEQK